MTKDPREILDKAPMSRLQIAIIVLTSVLNGIDGFDVLSISFASPGIAAEWSVDRGALGVVLSMELIGMAIGSIIIGGIADAIGRRRTMLGCLALMAFGMFVTPTSTSIAQLSFWRVLTGLGLGGLLAAVNATTAEFSNLRRRHFCVAIMSIGYPVGGVIGGSVASWLLTSYDWRSVFYLGATVTTLLIPTLYFLAPESVHWLVRKQPKGALEKVNKAMIRMGHAPIDVLPEVAPQVRKKSMGDLFRPGLLGVTVVVTMAYFLHITTYYFILKWVPKVVADLGFAVSSAGNVLVCANIGGAIGGTIFGLLSMRFDPKKLTVATMALGAVFIAAFGYSPADLVSMGLLAGLCGFFGNTAIVGMFALFAHSFPTHVRASGTGFAVGVGRGGAILSPIIVGFLFEWGFALPAVTTLIAIGGLAGAAVLVFLKIQKQEAPAAAALKKAVSA
ncbi:MAG: MFS transporter [Acidobacteria bacterium]|nr:MFS transporter [Acidobacteriota bacterium]